jgi:hypothetical protein
MLNSNTYCYQDPIKNNIYYYIDNLVRNCKNKTKQYEIWQLKMKLIYCKTLNEFEYILLQQRSYCVMPSNANCTPALDLSSKLNTINNILNKIKQTQCKHTFYKMTCVTDEDTKRVDDDNVLEEWIFTCSQCECTTKQLEIQLPGDQNSLNFPSEESFIKFCEICRIQDWTLI